MYEQVKIKSVTLVENEEEGGRSQEIYYPTGYMSFSGHASGRGYVPRLKDGWYQVDKKQLQAYFNQIAAYLAFYKPQAAAKEQYGTNNEMRVALESGEMEINPPLYSWAGLELNPQPVASYTLPPDYMNSKDCIIGRRLADKQVLDVIFNAQPEKARAFTAAQTAVYLQAVRDQDSHMMDDIERIKAVLLEIPAEHTSLLIPLLKDRFFRTSDMLAVLAGKGEKARPWTKEIIAAIQDDATLVEGSKALAAISGREALAWLKSKGIPKLSSSPQEPNLDLYYRVEFGKALLQIPLPEAREAYQRRVYPEYAARVKKLKPTFEGLGDLGSMVSAIGPDYDPQEIRTKTAASMVLSAMRAKDTQTRRAAITSVPGFFGKAVPAPILAELKEMLKEEDRDISVTAEEALRRMGK